MNKLLTFIFLLMLPTCIFAQFSAGIKAGLNIADIAVVNEPSGMYHSTKQDYQPKISYHFGGTVHYKFSDKTGIQTELLLSDKGTLLTETDYSSQSTIHFYYISTPILLKHKVFKTVGFEIGPEFNYLLTAQSKVDGETINVDFIWSKKFDLGINAGIFYCINKSLCANIRYNYGLSRLTDRIQYTNDNGEVIHNKMKYQNRVVQVSVSYTFTH